ncbi:hypothetical protein [Diaphorobacter aerolatus]|nr:hypothetical protein [Diaphorobacter aerolatus]
MLAAGFNPEAIGPARAWPQHAFQKEIDMSAFIWFIIVGALRAGWPVWS